MLHSFEYVSLLYIVVKENEGGGEICYTVLSMFLYYI
jgi:hypothetical protein